MSTYTSAVLICRSTGCTCCSSCTLPASPPGWQRYHPTLSQHPSSSPRSSRSSSSVSRRLSTHIRNQLTDESPSSVNGVVQPVSALPTFWSSWMYHLTPFTYLIEGLVSNALGGIAITWYVLSPRLVDRRLTQPFSAAPPSSLPSSCHRLDRTASPSLSPSPRVSPDTHKSSMVNVDTAPSQLETSSLPPSACRSRTDTATSASCGEFSRRPSIGSVLMRIPQRVHSLQLRPYVPLHVHVHHRRLGIDQALLSFSQEGGRRQGREGSRSLIESRVESLFRSAVRSLVQSPS